MMTDPDAFFAICAGAVLWGRAPGGAALRANVREKLPDFYGWIVKEFYPDGVSP